MKGVICEKGGERKFIRFEKRKSKAKDRKWQKISKERATNLGGCCYV